MEIHMIKGIIIMLLSSVTTCTGQLLWKLATKENSIWFLFLGFALYGIGAIFMMVALKFGELSVLHPMLSFGFILSIILGAIVFQEPITRNKIVGIFMIMIGMVLLSRNGFAKESMP